MKRILIFIILLNTILCFAQEFVLIPPNIAELKVASKRGDYKGNLLHLYLMQYYEGIPQLSQDAQVFSQESFGKDIVYMQVDSPQEGVLERISIPYSDRKTVIQWVEALNKFYETKDLNVWNFDQTTYAPIDTKGGGIFKITWEMNRVSIDRISSGC